MTFSRTARDSALAIALAAVYFAAGKLALKLAFVNPSATAVWPPTGIALAALLILGYRAWPGILLGAFLVNATTAGSPATSAGIAVGNTLEGLAGAWLVNRFAHGRDAFRRAADVFRFAVLGGLLATMVSATIGVSILSVGAFAQWHRFGSIWVTWWLGDAVGVLVVAPLLLLWIGHRASSMAPGRIVETALLFGLLIAVAEMVFVGMPPPGSRHLQLEFLCLPLLIWAAFRLGPREAATALAVLSAIAIRGTLHGRGPFVMGSPNASLLLLQAFMGVIAVTTTAMAAVVSERDEQSEAARRASEDRARAILDSMLEGLITTTEQGEIDSVNLAGQRIFGYSQEELVGRHLRTIVPGTSLDPERFLRTAKRIPIGEVVEMEGRRKNGESFPLEVALSEFQTADGRRFAGSLRDISERRAVERLKAEFVSTVSHDLRTPLTSIRGSLSLLAAGTLGELPEPAREAVTIAERNTIRLVALINDILDLEKLHPGRKSMQFASTPIQAVFDIAMEEIQEVARGEGIEIEIAPTQARAFADSQRLVQVLVNLLSNALKFSPRGSVVNVWAEGKPGWVVVFVKDRGCGVPRSSQASIFERFHQIATPGSGRNPGTGLGLAICRSIVEQHGGSIGVESSEGEGSTFWFRTPTMLRRASSPSGVSLASPEGGSA
jgi:PAS domain S-box-containing protein